MCNSKERIKRINNGNIWSLIGNIYYYRICNGEIFKPGISKYFWRGSGHFKQTKKLKLFIKKKTSICMHFGGKHTCSLTKKQPA